MTSALSSTVSPGDLSSSQLLLTTCRSLMTAINIFLERCDAETAHYIYKALFVLLAPAEIKLNQSLDNIRHFRLRNRRPQHFAERCVVALCATDRDLVELGALLVDAKNSNVADMMVAARVHAA